MRSRLVWSGPALGLILLLGIAGPAVAQPMGMPAQPTTVEGPSGLPSGLTIFVTADGGITPYTATYTGNLLFQDSSSILTLEETDSFTFTERHQRLLRLGGSVGLRFPLMDGLLMSVGFGGSHLELQEENLIDMSGTDSRFDNQHADFRTLEPNPGFAATLGVDWEALRRSHFSLNTGLKLMYVSSYGLRGTELDEGLNTQQVINEQTGLPEQGTDKNELFYSNFGYTDMVLHILSIQPHLGVEWRAVDSYLVNSFGVFANVVVSSGTLVKEQTLQLQPFLNGALVENEDELRRRSTELGLELSP
ncbi:MAG: hypothetical protein VX938_10085, partial [Myxococcota bacterium]|nr:hypothetical protein [Myxococcota bacterium]